MKLSFRCIPVSKMDGFGLCGSDANVIFNIHLIYYYFSFQCVTEYLHKLKFES